MSAGPSDRERISALEEHSASEREERRLTREKLHRHAGMIQDGANQLEIFKARLFGLAAGFGFASGLVAVLAMKLLFPHA